MVDISALLGEQPLIDEGGDEGNDEGLESTLDNGEGGDYEPTIDAPASEGEGEQPPTRNQKVPLAALHEERTKRQQVEAEAQQLRATQAQTMERLTKLLEAQQLAQQQQNAPEPEVVPSFVDDPEAAFNHLQRQLAAAQQQMQQYVNGNQQQVQAQQTHQQLTQHVGMQEAEFTKAQPDYPQAADYFYQRKVAEYAAITGNEVAAKQQVANDFRGIAVLAQNMGKNPAELMYNAAKAMGYAAAAPGAKKTPPTSLGNVHGSPRAPDEKGGISAADVANMTEAEFDKLWKDMSRGGVVRPKI